MTTITLQGGSIVLRQGKVGTGSACCCGACEDAPACCAYYVVGFKGTSFNPDGGIVFDPDTKCPLYGESSTSGFFNCTNGAGQCDWTSVAQFEADCVYNATLDCYQCTIGAITDVVIVPDPACPCADQVPAEVYDIDDLTVDPLGVDCSP